MTTASSPTIVLRRAVPADAASLERLAQLDSQRLGAGPYLVAERDGALIAAVPHSGGPAIADPFTPSADAVELLRRWLAQRTALPPRRSVRARRIALAS